MAFPLSIMAAGMVSPIAKSLAATCAAIRCGYDAFELSHFKPRFGHDNIACSTVDYADNIHGISKLSRMVIASISEALDTLGFQQPKNPLPLIICLPESSRTHYDLAYAEELFFKIQSHFPQFNENQTIIIREGRTSVAKALQYARRIVYKEKEPQVCIVAVDSYVNRNDIFRLTSKSENIAERVLTSTNSKGFIPGEASAAIIVSSPRPDESALHITGLGLAEEEAFLFSGKVLRARGLCEAINIAMSDAGIGPSDADLRLSSISGEPYFFEEMAIALQKKFRVLKPDYPLWAPADYLGETGAATGAVMLAYLHDCVTTNQIDGSRILCQLSGDNKDRAAIYLQTTNTKQGPTAV